MDIKKVIMLIILVFSLIFSVVFINIKLKAQESFKKEFAIEQFNESKEKETISEEGKISPNAILIKEINYKKCGHTTKKVENIPNSLVNLTFEELKDKVKEEYKDWILKDFNKNEVTLYMTEGSECDQEYVLREKDGKVVIYIKENGTENLFEETEIETEYLTEVDKAQLSKGIELLGKENLNAALEDYE